MTFTDVHMDRQKLGTILENKVDQKLKFSKNDNNKKPSSKLIFFNEKKIRKIQMIFDLENWLWNSDLGTLLRPMWTSVKVKSKNYFSITVFFAKIKPLLTRVRKTPPLHWGHTNKLIIICNFYNNIKFVVLLLYRTT